LERFRRAAAGTGIIPWHLDLDVLEEDWFLRLVSPPRGPASPQRALSVVGARVLARQLREAVAARHEAAVALVGRSIACPFDLHALVPVPDEVLCRGPNDPGSLAWLWEHWGTTEPLRHAENATSQRVPGGGDADQGSTGESRRHSPHQETAGGRQIVFTFWSADWTPWRALSQVAADWSALSLDVRPHYERA